MIQHRDQLVDEIARALEADHVYVARLDGRPLQSLVDMRWAMKTAGRTLGRPVQIDQRRADGCVLLVASTRS